MPLLEIVAYSYASALAAQQGGADRIELCENTAEGGTTPGLGTIEAVRELPGVKLHVMIRPRGGDFLYTDAEYKIMLRDIAVAREAGECARGRPWHPGVGARKRPHPRRLRGPRRCRVA